MMRCIDYGRVGREELRLSEAGRDRSVLDAQELGNGSFGRREFMTKPLERRPQMCVVEGNEGRSSRRGGGGEGGGRRKGMNSGILHDHDFCGGGGWWYREHTTRVRMDVGVCVCVFKSSIHMISARWKKVLLPPASRRRFIDSFTVDGKPNGVCCEAESVAVVNAKL